MYKINTQIQMKVDQLTTYVAENKKYGDFIPYSEIRDIVGVNPQSEMGYRIMKKANRQLEQERIQMETIMGKGKKILNPNEHLGASRKQAKKAITPIKNSIRLLNATNLDELSVSEKRQVISEANKYRVMKLAYDEIRNKNLIMDKKKVWKDSDKFKLLELFS